MMLLFMIFFVRKYIVACMPFFQIIILLCNNELRVHKLRKTFIFNQYLFRIILIY